jgi:hypothetical protein
MRTRPQTSAQPRPEKASTTTALALICQGVRVVRHEVLLKRRSKCLSHLVGCNDFSSNPVAHLFLIAAATSGANHQGAVPLKNRIAASDGPRQDVARAIRTNPRPGTSQTLLQAGGFSLSTMPCEGSDVGLVSLP